MKPIPLSLLILCLSLNAFTLGFFVGQGAAWYAIWMAVCTFVVSLCIAARLSQGGQRP